MDLDWVKQSSSKTTPRHDLKPNRSLLHAVLVGLALAFNLATAPDAQAAGRCTSKPAACALLKAREANQKPRKKSSKIAPVAAKAKRCLSKPAACALQRSMAHPPRPQRLAKPKIVHCTSKPAACALQRAKARTAAKRK